MTETSWRDRLLGSRDRLGWWTLPVFVAVGLAGAVLAGGLTAVYYGQQVGQLERETREGRAELRDAVEKVQEAGQQALDAIEEQVAAVEQSLESDLPVPSAFDAGVVQVRVVVERQDPPRSPDQPPPPPVRTVRDGSAFAVARAGGETFFVTTFELVADPAEPGQAFDAVQITTAGGARGAAVHSWDVDLDLAILRAPVEVAVPSWRPPGETVEPGHRVIAVGLSPNGGTLQAEGAVTGVEARAVLTDLPRLDLVRGGPLVDLRGRVVAITSLAYDPYGTSEGTNASVPIRVLCERLLRCGPEQLGEGGEGESEEQTPAEPGDG